MSAPIRQEEVRHTVMPQSEQNQLSASKQCIIGGLVGGFEPFIGTAFNNVKQALQQGQEIPRSAHALWGGTLINSVYCASVTAPQFFVRGILTEYFSKNGQVQLQLPHHFAVAFSSAVASSVIATPSEMVMAIYAENMRKHEILKRAGKPSIKPTYKTTVQNVFKKYGVSGFSRGWQGIVLRDAGFVFCYSKLAKVLSKEAEQITPTLQVANLLGGITAGVIGAATTHHFDTWKTRREMGMTTTLRQFAKEGHKGMLARTFRVGVAVGIYNVMTDELTDLFQKIKL